MAVRPQTTSQSRRRARWVCRNGCKNVFAGEFITISRIAPQGRSTVPKSGSDLHKQ